MPATQTETPTTKKTAPKHRTTTTRTRERRNATPPHDGPDLANVRRALRDLGHAVLDVAHAHALASERPCIRRVRRALLSRRDIAPDFADAAITAEVLLRSFESRLGPVDDHVRHLLALQLASTIAEMPDLEPASAHPRAPHARTVASTAPRREPRRAYAAEVDGGLYIYG